MIFTPLFSSSHGNAYTLEHPGGRLLIECGAPYKRMQEASGFSLSRCSGCLISHEHGDHARSWKDVCRMGVRLYATQGTMEKLGTGPGFCTMLDGEETAPGRYVYDLVRVGGFSVRPFQTFHDAAEPVGFLIRSERDGEQLVFATDTVNLAYRFPPVEYIAVECNYDPALLKTAERIPAKTKDRITRTHMDIRRLLAFLRRADRSRLKTVYLLHLSDATSNQWRFQRDVRAAVGEGPKIVVCPRE